MVGHSYLREVPPSPINDLRREALPVCEFRLAVDWDVTRHWTSKLALDGLCLALGDKDRPQAPFKIASHMHYRLTHIIVKREHIKKKGKM